MANAQGMKYAVICAGDVTGEPCNDGKPIEISEENYMAQMSNPWARWKCPKCRGIAYWDDDCC